MTETPETPETPTITYTAEIVKTLYAIDAQVRANGEQLTRIATTLDDLQTRAGNHSSALRSARTILDEIQTVVRDAAPLLNSRPARALRSGGNVLDYLKGGRSGG